MIVRQSDSPSVAHACRARNNAQTNERARCPQGGRAEPFGTLHLEHSSTVDRVADELRRAVFDGELESGTPLREVALAESLGVSRPTVREALGVLVAEGLATREPNRGVSRRHARTPTRCATSAAPALVLEGAGVRRWPTADEHAARRRSATSLAATRARSRAGRRTRSSTSATSPSTSPWSG